MSKTSRRNQRIYNVFRILVVLFFVGGFTYQALEFLLLYWTYPTVVDIQQSSPFYLDIPSFTFCNKIGYNYANMCSNFKGTPCASSMFNKVVSDVVCKQFPRLCNNNTLPSDFRTVFHGKLMKKNFITKDDYGTLSIPLETYLNCTIEFAGNTTDCNLENVLGSFYSEDDLPQFCYTIYSLWGKPDKKREKIAKGSTMRFHIFFNATNRPLSEYNGSYVGPLFNPPSDASLQLAVHSPFFLPSPLLEGFSFLGGRNYELRIKQSESHLLPLPYQTNCTDYMTMWKARGGKAPINQLGVIQECRMNQTYKALGCIPINIDYPHTYTICKSCEKPGNCSYVEPPNDCTRLADNYNQPCDSMTYDVELQNKVITLFKEVDTVWSKDKEGLRIVLAQHDCEGNNVWNLECSTVDIEVPFDRYDITNITYNPKFESLEVFSVIGGYMGMWLGISLLAIFDMLAEFVVFVKSLRSASKIKKLRAAKLKVRQKNGKMKRNNVVTPTTYNVW